MAEPAAVIAFGICGVETWGVQPRWVQTPTRISHSGLMSRFSSVAGALSGRLSLSASGSGRLRHRHRIGFGDFGRRTAAHEQRMAAEFKDDLLARLDRRKDRFRSVPEARVAEDGFI